MTIIITTRQKQALLLLLFGSTFMLVALQANAYTSIGFSGSNTRHYHHYHHHRTATFDNRNKYTDKARMRSLLALSSTSSTSTSTLTSLSQDDMQILMNEPTELPDSIEDSANMAAKACIQLSDIFFSNNNARCRVDFDTSNGDETFTTLKTSTEFMQLFTTQLSRGMISNLIKYEQDIQIKVINARTELQNLLLINETNNNQEEETENETNDNDNETNNDNGSTSDDATTTTTSSSNEEETKRNKRIEELQQIIANGGITAEDEWTGDIVRVYFPDEGNAALAKRDWKGLVPPCVEYSSLGGVQVADTSRDKIVLYFCPRAAESEYLEQTLQNYELDGNIKLSVLINPLLVDMGVTGFGMAGRMLRERLLDNLQYAYYLRTLQWGALTRCWPRKYSVWQEDTNETDGYRLIETLSNLPSNPEVEDIYDIANGDKQPPKDGIGILNAIGDFVQGMTRL